MRRLVDLSHDVYHGLVTYRGLPAPEITEHMGRAASRANYEAGTEFHIGRISLVANTGTYVDSPFHRYADGADLAGLPLESVADLPGVCVDARGTGAVDVDRFAGVDCAGRAVLVHTGWSRHWDTEAYFEGSPYLTAAAAQHLVNAGAALVGIDAYNVDDASTRSRPVHSALLAAGIPVVEHLTGLDGLPPEGFRFTAAPVKVRDFGTFPVRAFAVLGS